MPSLSRLKFARGALVAGVITLWALPALGEDAVKPETVRIQGTIEKSDAQTVTVRTKDGISPAVAITAETLIVRNEPATLDQVKAGDFVASAAVKGEDGKFHSRDLRIFPEALRGLGEGQRPMSEPDTTMTNASVTEVVTAVQGRVLKVKYKDGTSELIVGPDVPITALVVIDPAALKSGMKVTITASKAADGAMTATRIFVGRPVRRSGRRVLGRAQDARFRKLLERPLGKEHSVPKGMTCSTEEYSTTH